MKTQWFKHMPALLHIVAFIIFFSAPLQVRAQGLKTLNREDYGRWGNLHPQGLSHSGRWASFKMEYKNGKDTLFIKNTATGKSFSFPGASSGSFAGDNAYGVLYPDRTLEVVDLLNRKKGIFEQVTKFGFSACGKYLAVLQQNLTYSDLLVYRNGKLLKTVRGATAITWSADNRLLAYTAGNSGAHTAGVLSFTNQFQDIPVASGNRAFKRITFSGNAQAVLFYSSQEAAECFSAVHCYLLNEKRLYTFSPEAQVGFPKDMQLYSGYSIPVRISGDHKRVFFGISSTIINNTTDTPLVELWNGNDNRLYPMKKQINGWKNYPKLGVWELSNGTFRQISSQEFPWVMLTGDQKHALVANPGEYPPDYTLEGRTDYYLQDVSTGALSPVIKGISAQTMNIAISPDGRYIAYYTAENWWLYDIARNTHRNMTGGLLEKWDHSGPDPANAKAVYGITGFTTDQNAVIISDAFDLWLFPLSGAAPTRLTTGREQGIRFTIDQMDLIRGEANYSGRPEMSIDLSKKLLLKAKKESTAAQGYYTWAPGNIIKPLFFKDNHTSSAMRSGDQKVYSFMEQDFRMPPRIILKKGNREKIVHQGNSHHFDYTWGTAQMMHYLVEGKQLNAAVFYPPGYASDKAYPTVVYIYEKLSQYVHQYVNPSMENTAGCNISNLLSQGYVVMLPDIEYTKGNPGDAALKCVTAATQKLIRAGIADPRKIGLTGHSFGGYQTNYIITHSDLFAAAVSGSGVSDFVSAYFTYGKMIGEADMWRYESQQFRMGKPFFDAQEDYFRNSPILSADKVTAPVLLWTGDADDIISPAQTMELYLALRRLGKRCIMLSYPGMQHNPTDPGQSADLTRRLESWFAYYLKGETGADWISEGTQ